MRQIAFSRPVVAAALLACVLPAACMSGSPRKEVERLPDNEVGRPVLESSEAMSLQSSIMALADTSMQRIGSELVLGNEKDRTPEARRDDANTRLVLASALIAIAVEPDPVDALADILTNTTLTADAQRNAARGKPADSPEARLLSALELNEADAWKLAERWVNAPTREALKARIEAWPGNRSSAIGVAYVRMSDVKRGGVASVEGGDGMFDSLRAATDQADQVRLLAERSIFLTQRFPFLLRWQAEVYTTGALATREAQQTQAQLEQMTAISASMSQILAGMTDQLSRERQAALADLFDHIAGERKATLDQVLKIVQQERTATLAEAGKAIDQQRQATIKDILKLADTAGRTGNEWIGRALVVGGVLILLLLMGLLGVMLLYRRLAPVVQSRAGAR
jgi:hypothetical protein